MTEEEGTGGAKEPVEIHPNYVKLYLLTFFFALFTAFCARAAVRSGDPAATVLLALMAGVSGATAYLVYKRASRRHPLLTVSAAGVDDARYGFIPWSNIRRWRHSRSIINPGLGFDLAPGAELQRNRTLFRLAAAINWLSGIGQRTYRKQMILGGLQPVADAFRKFRPDLEVK